MEHMPKRKKRKRLSADLCLSIHGGWRAHANSRGDCSDCNFDAPSRIGNFRGTSLDYDMSCDPLGSDNDDKEGDKLSIQNLTTNIDIFSVPTISTV